MVDIFTTNNKYDIIYADPPWSYYNDMSVDVDCTTVRGMRMVDMLKERWSSWLHFVTD